MSSEALAPVCEPVRLPVYQDDEPIDWSKPLDLDRLIGKGYEKFWNFKGRYRLVKGSRMSKKSITCTYWYILNMMANPLANTLVVRATEKSNRDSTFPVFVQRLERLGLLDQWSIHKNTMTITRKETGQEIRFAGFDNPHKLTSMGVAHGYLCWVWLEEAWQMKNYEEIQILDHSIRGVRPKGLFDQFTITFNPWTPFWAKWEYFDKCDPSLPVFDLELAQDCLCMTTTYKCNEWLKPQDWKGLERLKKTHPLQYEVEALGNWGVPGETIYDGIWDVVVPEFTPEIVEKYRLVDDENKRKELIYNESKQRMMENLKKRHPSGRFIHGLDFGFTISNTAFVSMFVDPKSHQAWIYNEIIMVRTTCRQLGDKLKNEGYQHVSIIADSAEPKSIMELMWDFGFTDIVGCRKGGDSVGHGIQFIRGYSLHILSDCIQTIEEIKVYCYERDPVTGELTDEPVKGNDHCMDAMRYAMSDIALTAGFM